MNIPKKWVMNLASFSGSNFKVSLIGNLELEDMRIKLLQPKLLALIIMDKADISKSHSLTKLIKC